MRSKNMLSLGLAVLLILSACSPSMLNKFEKNSLFARSILVKPSVTSTVQTSPSLEIRQFLITETPGSTIETVNSTLTGPTATPAISGEATQPEPSRMAPKMAPRTDTPQAIAELSPTPVVGTVTPSPMLMTPTGLIAGQSVTETAEIKVTPSMTTPAVSAQLLTSLARLFYVDPSKLVVSDLESITWANLCFDFPRKNLPLCNSVATPGYQGRVQSKQNAFGGDPEYAFRSDAAGNLVYTIPVAALAARNALTSVSGADPETIRFIQVEKWDWPDTCAMTPMPLPKDAVCLSVSLPGWRVVLSANGLLYQFHTDLNGQVVQLIP